MNKLTRILTDSNIRQAYNDVLEVGLDSLLDSGVLKEIPIIGTISNIQKGVRNVQDTIFARKLLSFINPVSEVTEEERRVQILKIEEDDNYRQSVGSKIMYLIDKAQDHLFSRYIGLLFVDFLKNNISYEEFCKASLILNRIDYYDLQTFLSYKKDNFGGNGTENMGIEEHDVAFISSGLCYTVIDEVTVEDEDDYKMERAYKVSGGQTEIYMSLIGGVIHRVLNQESSND